MSVRLLYVHVSWHGDTCVGQSTVPHCLALCVLLPGGESPERAPGACHTANYSTKVRQKEV